MVGHAMLKSLAQENCTILSAPHEELDLTQQSITREWLADSRPDVIIMAAAEVGGIGANKESPAAFLYDNLAMAQNVIHGAYKAGVSKLLYLGSSCIYPKMAPQPIREKALLTGPLEPTNEAYAIAKIAGLKLCQYYKQQYGCNFISAMPSNLYGPHDTFEAQKSHVIPALILKFHEAKIKNESEVILWGTGTALREFLYVEDLADALIHLVKYYDGDDPVNIGSGDEISIADLSLQIKNIVGYEGKVVFDPAQPEGTPRKLLDSSRMMDLGWCATTGLEAGLQTTYEWFLQRPS